ncbi:hypothetical protein J7K56_04140 [Candidatus Calescamantes bacterium]|nr:hypothetical protein [Candidatus Calescamantes bacterium]
MKFLVGTVFLFLLLGISFAQEKEVIIFSDFESGTVSGWWELRWGAKLTQNSQEIINGKYSLKADTTNSSARWHEFLRGKIFPKEKGEKYIVSFDYKILNRKEDAYFYFICAPHSGVGHICFKKWKEPLGKIEQKRVVFRVPSTGRYNIIFGIHRQGSICLDNIKIISVLPLKSIPQTPKLLYPRDKMLLTNIAVSFSWVNDRIRFPKYELQLSRTESFEDAQCFEIPSSIASTVSFLPEHIPAEGKWFWRVRGIKGKQTGEWSETRSFIVKPYKVYDKICLSISPERPLLILSTGDYLAGDCWDALPDSLKPYVVLREEKWGRKNLESIKETGAAVFLQPSHHSPLLPLSLIEEIFLKYPSVKGCFLAEWNSLGTGKYYNEQIYGARRTRKEYTKRLIMLAHCYGKLVAIADHDSTSHRFLEIGSCEDLFRTFKKYRENVVLLWKQNSPYSSHLVHSAVMGLWLSDACKNWGVASESWYWGEAGFGELGIATGRHDGNIDLMPDNFLGILMLLGTASGATVYGLEWPLAFTQERKLSQLFSEVMLPLFQKLVEWELIPSKKEVISNIPVGYQATKKDLVWDKGYGRLSTLFDVAYNLFYFNQIIPKPGRRAYYFIPVFPELACKEDLSFSIKFIPPSKIEDREFLKELFEKSYPQKKYKGNAFVIKLGNNIYACNPWENWDTQSWFSLPLKAPFANLKVELPTQSFLVGKCEGDKLMLYLNGRKERKVNLAIVCGKKVRVEANPSKAVISQSYSDKDKTLSLIVTHQFGGCELILKLVR